MNAIGDAGPAKVVFLLHLGPLPTPVTHYVVTFSKEVTFWPCLSASVLGSLPSNVMTVLFGENIKGIAAILSGEKTDTTQVWRCETMRGGWAPGLKEQRRPMCNAMHPLFFS